MGKVAFVFSGQGDQYPGMGQSLCEQYQAAADVFQLCDRLRPGTSAQCFEGTEEALQETKNTQPCLFAMELAAFAALKEAGVQPDAVAGFSLGEVTAATAAGIVDYETGFQLVCKRGELMQQAAQQHDTSMAAVVKLTPEAVQSLCEGYSGVYPVNFNCPGQITVSGLSEQMSEFFVRVKNAGGRAIPLKVKGAFHSPFMEEAAFAFAEELSKAALHRSTVPIYSNVTGALYTDDVAELLSKQICSPVQWETIVRNLIASGIDTFVEIGPGKTLCNMIRKIDPGVKTNSVSELSGFLWEVQSC